MAITPKAVQELREKTGVGMMDCKRALEEAGGDMEEAVKILRKKGMATAEKKSMRAASDGLIVAFVTADGHTGALLEINCETDFVAKTDDFQGLAAALCAQVAEKAPADEAALLEQPCISEPSTKVKDLIVAKVAKLGENIQLRRFIRYHGDAAFASSYIHAGGKIGVLMECEAPDATEEVKAVAKDLCMQVAAAAPKFVSRQEVTPEVLESEKEIYRAQVLAQGKPANIVDKIVEGKMNKYYEEACLLEQAFIKDTAVSVQKHIDAAAKGLKVVRFTRYVLGEGLKSSACDAQ
jgi:elongation factor Ts